jgi:hypothetical protein
MESSKGTTGCTVVYEIDNEGVFVYYLGKCVYHIPDHEVPDEVLYHEDYTDDEDTLFNWAMENYSSEIAECIEAYEYKPE